MNKDRSAVLGEGSIPRLLLTFSTPAIVGATAQALYNFVDRWFVSRAMGENGIAGITVSFPAMLVIFAFSMLIGFGAAALVSIRLGQQNKQEAQRVLGTAVVLLAAVSLALTVAGLAFIDPILAISGARRGLAVCPAVPPDHRGRGRFPGRRVRAECRDPRRGESSDRDDHAARWRVLERPFGANSHFRSGLGNERRRDRDGGFSRRLRILGRGAFLRQEKRSEAPLAEYPPAMAAGGGDLRSGISPFPRAACRQRDEQHPQ